MLHWWLEKLKRLNFSVAILAQAEPVLFPGSAYCPHHQFTGALPGIMAGFPDPRAWSEERSEFAECGLGLLCPVSKVNLVELNELIRADRARLKRQPPARFASAKLSAERSARKESGRAWEDHKSRHSSAEAPQGGFDGGERNARS